MKEYDENVGVMVDPDQPTDEDTGVDRFRTLPERNPPEDMVEEVPSEDPTPDTNPVDPNREVAWRYGLGM